MKAYSAAALVLLSQAVYAAPQKGTKIFVEYLLGMMKLANNMTSCNMVMIYSDIIKWL